MAVTIPETTAGRGGGMVESSIKPVDVDVDVDTN